MIEVLKKSPEVVITHPDIKVIEKIHRNGKLFGKFSYKGSEFPIPVVLSKDTEKNILNLMENFTKTITKNEVHIFARTLWSPVTDSPVYADAYIKSGLRRGVYLNTKIGSGDHLAITSDDLHNLITQGDYSIIDTLAQMGVLGRQENPKNGAKELETFADKVTPFFLKLYEQHRAASKKIINKTA
jgi:hypothetical protein